MKQFTMLCLALAAGLAQPAAAADGPWSHEASGVAIDRKGPDLRMGAVNDLTQGRQLDNIIQFGSGNEFATIYLYRSSYPNPAIWIQRTLAQVLGRWPGAPDAAPEPVAFTVGGAPAPNGMRTAFEVEDNREVKSTAMALIHHDGWMLKYRVTSSALDLAGINARLDALIAMTHFAGGDDLALPLELPHDCEDTPRYAGESITGDVERELSLVMFGLLMSHANSMGIGGLAEHPSQWCKAEAQDIPVQVAEVYRKKDAPGDWVMLVADSGGSISASNVDLPDDLPDDGKPAPTAKAVLFTSRHGTTTAVAPFTFLPRPGEEVLRRAMSVLLSGKGGIISIGVGKTEEDGDEDAAE